MKNPFLLKPDTSFKPIPSTVELNNLPSTSTTQINSIPSIHEINENSKKNESPLNKDMQQTRIINPFINPTNTNTVIISQNNPSNPIIRSNPLSNTNNLRTKSDFYITSPSLITNQVPTSILNNQQHPNTKTNIYVIDSINKFDVNPTMTTCPYCKESNVITQINKKLNIPNLSFCCLFGPLVYIGFQLIREKRLSFMDVTHSCPVCKSQISKYYAC